MNSLSIAILVVILINISHEYYTNCFRNIHKPCTVLLKPGEAAYTLFHRTLSPSEIKNVTYLCSGETDQGLINEENESIKKYVSAETLRTFFHKLRDVFYMPGSNVEIIPCTKRMYRRYYSKRRPY
uniref:Uncharacterized protein n=1 Tax=Strongyloides venezuelensis TaxID=75913 RepID=A0A0K0FIU0_STRVS